MGTMACYGDMTVTLGSNDGEGFVDCQPAWGSAAAPPQVSSVLLLILVVHQTIPDGDCVFLYLTRALQGIIADGSDGSHWVTVDDKGSGDCDGTIWYEYGDLGLGYCNRLALDDGKQTRLFCGYATCDGYLNIQCTMLSGCHGA